MILFQLYVFFQIPPSSVPKMFSKKCMVVGSLLVMAAQTATAASTCSGMAGLVDTICGQNGYAGVLVDNAGAVDCAGDTCNNNDAITCCKPAALCTTITDVSDPFALSEVCSDNAVYANAVTVGAFCAGTACALSDESRCCVVKANCDTITLGTSPSLTEVCGGDDAFTGALIGSASSTKCAGAACGLVDKSTCCAQKATCGTITADSSPNLATVCGNDPGYTGALGSSSAKCAGATCGTSDKGTCCAEKSSAGDDGDDDDNDDDDDNKFSNTCTAPKKQCEGSHEYLSGFKGGCHSCDDGPESCADLVSMIKKGGCYAECAGKIVFFHPLFYVLI